jgi:RimJ/RimL family protein N-acetyltransferase
VNLEGKLVLLEPLAAKHEEPLREAASDPAIWRFGYADFSRDFDPWWREARATEIGWTWVIPQLWGSGVNIEAKLLMLEHAFERLGAARVEFKTEATNERSRAALAALPAQFEGIFRHHLWVRGGEWRDSAYYSVLEEEWPEVRANLERRLAAKSSAVR